MAGNVCRKSGILLMSKKRLGDGFAVLDKSERILGVLSSGGVSDE